MIQTVRIAIVGGGLAGLYAAYLLEQKGIHDYVVLEAREYWGGRITTTPSSTESSALDRFDLGPTWFWPAYQPQLDRLIQNLGLERFAQHETGSMLVERTPHGAPERMPGYTYAPPSMRLIGGMSALIDALQRPLPPHKLLLNHRVRRMRSEGQHVELDAEAAPQTLTFRVESLLLAVPPRLAATTIDFLPPLPEPLMQAWCNTATWMAPHAKYVAVHDQPFWRAQGLSGEARSACGPLGEIHDASMPGGSAALFGFFALPAAVRKGIPEETLRMHCRAQFARLFGEQAATPRADFIKDWAADPWTATEADQNEVSQHGLAPQSSAAEDPWRGRLTGIASEWSPQFPGYVAGAIEAAALGVDKLLRQTP
ncbi:Monoamine oxidase [Thiomonas bhubaneswarensis]|uniref:Monoamine oxidase n=1 Tax=Thiomonas bhubaneswarensis TaxID=339866 RepID=A0A0K6I8E5_9BURK|nr:Monoamine oxidase [Thiomonas bhubaneswarensis]